VIKVAGWFELTFVNGMGAPFNTGVIIYVLLIIGALVWGIRYTLKKGMPVWNTILTCFMVILIGYSSYSMIVIRSLSDPPIDEGSPDNVFSLLSYINRDQYGDAPLLYGQYFNAPQVGTKEGEPIYYQNKETGVYEKIGNKTIYTTNGFVVSSHVCTAIPGPTLPINTRLGQEETTVRPIRSTARPSPARVSVITCVISSIIS
jgi:hypothetical protein